MSEKHPENPEESFERRYQRIMEAAGVKTDAELARILEIQPPSITGAKKRRSIPMGWYEKISSTFGTDLNWLLYGDNAARRAVTQSTVADVGGSVAKLFATTGGVSSVVEPLTAVARGAAVASGLGMAVIPPLTAAMINPIAAATTTMFPFLGLPILGAALVGASICAGKKKKEDALPEGESSVAEVGTEAVEALDPGDPQMQASQQDGENEGKAPPPPVDVDMIFIPMVEAVLSAGSGSLETSADSERRYAFRSDFLHRKGNPDAMVLMRVSGDSMEPEIKNGDVVLLDQSKQRIMAGRFYAVGFEDAIYIKQIDMLPGKVVLRSLNTTYPPVELDVREDLATQFRVVGQVLWVGREYH